MGLKAVETSRGLCRRWINASGFRQSTIHLLDALLSNACETGHAIRRSDAEILEGWWDMVVFIRYLAYREDIWPCLFRNRLRNLLGLSKRMSGMGVGEAVWTSGDATPTCLAGVNWANNEYAKLTHCGILHEFTNRHQSCNLIAEFELAAAISVVITWAGPQMTSGIVLNGSDNTNVLSWIRKRKANNRMAFRMLNCLHMWCIQYDIDLYGLMLKSMRNVSPAVITRASPTELQERGRRLSTKRILELPNLKLFASCIPILEGPLKEGEIVDLGKLRRNIDYWCGVLAECDPFAGTLHRWAEDNDIRYDVWFSEPQKMASMWKKTASRLKREESWKGYVWEQHQANKTSSSLRKTSKSSNRA